MKRLAAALALLLAAAPAAANDPAEVVAAERAFAAMAQEKGVTAAFRAWSAEDAIAFQPDPVPAKATFAAEGPPISLKWWPVHAGIAASGDLGYTTGPFVLSGERGTMHGWFFTVWSRQADGNWRWVLDHGPPMHEAAPFGPETPVAALPAAAAPPAGLGTGGAWAELLSAEAALARSLAEDAPAAYAAALADDARIMRPGPQPAVGRAAFEEALRAGPARIRAAHLGGGVSKAGDLAWSYGNAAWERDGQPRRGHYVRIWQRRADGWRIVMDEIIPVPPPPKSS